MNGWRLAAAALILATSCRRQTIAPDRTGAPGPVQHGALPTDAWVGKWVGVEGLALDIQPRGAAGHYRLIVRLLDGVEQFAGVADGAVIRFTRDGNPAVVRHVTGRETGLKWLADKKDCLMIEPGEGFCRG